MPASSLPDTVRAGWPRWYGTCRLSDSARSEIARWAFYNVGATMRGQYWRQWHGPVPRDHGLYSDAAYRGHMAEVSRRV